MEVDNSLFKLALAKFKPRMKNLGIISLAFLVVLGCTQDQRGNLSNIFMNKRSFEELVNSFESEEREEYQKPEQVIDLLGDIQGKKIMDIGAGTGYFAFRMAERGAQVIAADVDDRFLEYMKEKNATIKNSKITTRKVEFEDPLLSKDEVDHVIIVNTYHHIDNREEYFTKVANGIKNAGSLMVVDFKKDVKSPGPPKRYRVSTKNVAKELTQAGFKTFEINTDLLENQYIVIAHK